METLIYITSWYDIWYTVDTAQKLSFLLRISSINVTKSAVYFTEEILKEKRDFLWSVSSCVVQGVRKFCKTYEKY